MGETVFEIYSMKVERLVNPDYIPLLSVEPPYSTNPEKREHV